MKKNQKEFISMRILRFYHQINMKLNDDSLKVIGIGRHNNPACSTDLFFSNELIFELHEHGFDKGFIFA